MKLPALAALAAILPTLPLSAAPLKVACVGDSVTLGIGVADAARESYPAQLARLLGRRYDVRNFGVSGATMLRDSPNSYWETDAFRDALAFRPDIVVVLLGTNDSKTRHWDGRAEEFRPDYEAFLARFAKLDPKPRLLLALPPPCFRDDGDIRERILRPQRKIIAQLAADQKLPVIDLPAALRDHPAWLPDGIHPNAAGARAIAQTVAAAIRS